MKFRLPSISRLPIRKQLLMLIGAAVIAVTAAAAAAGYAARLGLQALEFEHERSFVPVVALGTINSEMRDTSFRLAGVLIDQIPMEGSKNKAVEA